MDKRKVGGVQTLFKEAKTDNPLQQDSKGQIQREGGGLRWRRHKWQET